jgi:hypothetical protein
LQKGGKHQVLREIGSKLMDGSRDQKFNLQPTAFICNHVRFFYVITYALAAPIVRRAAAATLKETIIDGIK